MPSEMEFVTFKQFIDGLTESEEFAKTGKGVVCDSVGPKAAVGPVDLKGLQKNVSTESSTSQVKQIIKKNNLIIGRDGIANNIKITSFFEVFYISGTPTNSGILSFSEQISFDSEKDYTLVILPIKTTRSLTFAFYSNSNSYLKVGGSTFSTTVSSSPVVKTFRPDSSASWAMSYFVYNTQSDDECFAVYVVEGSMTDEDVFELSVRCAAEVAKQEEKNLVIDERIDSTNERVTEIYDKLKKIRLSIKDDITIHIPNNTESAMTNVSVNVNVHKGEQQGITSFDEIFVGDDEMFEQFRFFDGETELNHELVASGNYDLIKDASVYSGQKGIFHMSDNSLIVTRTGGVFRSADNGVSYSQVYSGGSCVFIDSNDNIYIYKDYLIHKYNMTSQVDTVVADFTQREYTDLFTNRIGEDSEGTIYIGTYATPYGSAQVYRMKSGESVFTQVFDDQNRQHIHRLYIDKASSPNKIFIGVDGVREGYMPAGYVSTDGGDTWTNLNIPYNDADCGIVYHSGDYYFGCGETNYLGGPTIYRTTDFENFEGVAYNLNGARMIVEPVPGFLIAFLSNGAANCVEQLIMSTDNGATWKPMCVSNIVYKDISGDGLARATDYFKPMGADEYQIIGDGFSRSYGYRLYVGGSRRMASFIINVGDVPVGGKDIILRRDYMLDASSRVLTLDKEIHSPIFTMNLSEGEGTRIFTSAGVKEITGSGATWENAVGVNNGSVFGSGARSPKGLVLGESSYINIGKLPIQNGTFTFAFWINPKNKTEGSSSFILRAKDNSFRLYHGTKFFSFVIQSIAGSPGILSPSYYFGSDYYLPYYLVVEYDGVSSTSLKLYIGDGRLIASITMNARVPDLSDVELIIGHNSPSGTSKSCICGLSAIAIFDKALTGKEIMDYNNFRNYLA